MSGSGLGLDFGTLVDSLAQSFGNLFGNSTRPQAQADPFGGAVGGGYKDPFGGAVGSDGVDPFANSATTPTFGLREPFAGVWQPTSPFMFGQAPNKPTSDPGGFSSGGGGTGGGSSFGGPSSGLEPDVAKWAPQVQQTFADIQGLDPDTMLAIMTNESHGNPNAYNAAGDAYGLFQNVGLGSFDPQAQFKAAHDLAAQKMAAINAAYAANGLNPDARTRARDFALAWAGHFDYTTGEPNPNSRDIGSGQTADELANVFLTNYDKIKAGRAQATSGGGVGSVTPGVQGSIMQTFGPTDYAQAHPDTYAYGAAYGLVGAQHPGIDWAVPLGSRVATPLGGTVTYAGGTGYYTDTMSGVDPAHSGEFMVTLDNGDQLILGHLSSINVQAGQRVNPGDLIGLSGGSDGAHVHVEYRQRQADGSYRIIDPRQVIRF